jgi:hypothetical protein
LPVVPQPNLAPKKQKGWRSTFTDVASSPWAKPGHAAFGSASGELEAQPLTHTSLT